MQRMKHLNVELKLRSFTKYYNKCHMEEELLYVVGGVILVVLGFIGEHVRRSECVVDTQSEGVR